MKPKRYFGEQPHYLDGHNRPEISLLLYKEWEYEGAEEVFYYTSKRGNRD